MVPTVTATPAIVNLVWYRGDSWSQTFRFLSEDVPIPLAGLTVQAEVRNTLGDRFDLVASILDAANGTIQISPPVGGLPPDLYDYDIEVVDEGAVNTWVRGKLRVERDVTNELA